MEAVLNSVGGKASNPSVIAESVGFLARALQHFHVTTQQPGLPTRRTLFMRILAPMVPLMEARTDYVRYAAYSAVAAARIFLADEQAYSQLTFESVDASKKTRIDSALIKLQSETAAPVKRPPEFTESKGLFTIFYLKLALSCGKTSFKKRTRSTAGIITTPGSQETKDRVGMSCKHEDTPFKCNGCHSNL